MTNWQVQEAKTKLSEVIERASREGPQTITKHGKARAVLISIDDYEAMKRSQPNLIDYLKTGPFFDDVHLERSPDTGREIDLE
jgi:prevent-host-death family protein